MKISCPICDNNMEITNKVFSKNNFDATSDSIVSDNDSEISNLQEEDIQNILANNMHNIKLTSKNFDIDDIYKNPHFNKLTDNQKTLIINRVDDKISKLKAKAKSSSKASSVVVSNETVYKKDSYFYCKTCGHSSEIPSETLVFSRGCMSSHENNTNIDLNNVSVYPITKNYNCINENCKTHKEPGLKEAVMRRVPGEYIIKYKCNVCEFNWDSFIKN